MTTPADLVFTTSAKTGAETQLTPFTLDGEQLQAHKPKDAVAFWIRRILVDEDDIEAVVGGYEKFIHYVFPADTRTRLLARLEDVDDDFDISDMNVLLMQLFTTWGVIDEEGNPVTSEPKPARARGAKR